MPDINILSPHLADLIAAGEVVERPASVIKELCENSFDAGAANITIELKGGGMTYIRVTDDGCGMGPEDAGVCFLRHATSKLFGERGLEAIGTLGFRGEALAAIASVSKIELITRQKGAEVGTRVLLEAGDIIEMTPWGCGEGTSIIIRDLFYNTPARLKFMKSDRSEASACIGIALRCALGRPEVSVRLIRDGNEEFFSPGDGKRSSCTYSLLGRDLSKELLECTSEDEGYSVHGFVGSPKFGHGNRGKQFFFCNGRCIKSPLLQAAVEQAYKNSMLTGRYPSCIIYLTLSPASVDVNVHPAKTEVRFREERRVFDAVHYAAISAIKGEGDTAEIRLSPSTTAVLSTKKDFFKTMNSSDYREKFSDAPHRAGGSFMPSAPSSPPPAIDRGTVVLGGHGLPSSGQTRLNDSFSPYNKSAPVPTTPPFAAPTQRSPEAHTIPEAFEPFRLVGEAMKTYIIIERGQELILIDKHAAHERMIFDRLKTQGLEIMSQALLVPLTIKLPSDHMELLEKNGELLSKLGFELAPYGEDNIILRGVPADTDAADAGAMIEEICDKLRGGHALSHANALDEILHTVACKAAIKAGYNTDDTELRRVAEEVISGRVKYCPHGRPVSAILTKKQLDKEFSRIV